ncbi:MAG: hypothetical protein ABUL62_15950 [Myxococcales bacterium]
MMRSLTWLIPFSLALAAASCNDSDGPPASNGVPNPDAGAGGSAARAGAGGTSSTAGKAGAGGSVTGAGAPGAGATAEAGSAPVSEGGSAGMDDSEGGAAGAPPDVNPFDGSCATLPGTVVYIESGDTQENLLKNLGRHLRDTANITLAFNLTGSCTLASDMYAYTSAGTKVVKSGTLKYIPSTAEDSTWTPAMAEPTCTTGADGIPIDVAISALFVDSCSNLAAKPASLALIQGPVQAYTFVVPTGSQQTAIWSQEARYAFGLGANNPLSPTYNPWNDEQFMFIRPVTKSTLVATALNIELLPSLWKGQKKDMSSDVVTAVKGSTKPLATIGILGAEVYDSNRQNGIKTLAFQAKNQAAAYYPDSTSTSFDKQNVRDGHYTLWSPTVYIAPVDGSQVPTNPAVKYLVDLVQGTTATPPHGTSFDALKDIAKVGLVPDCAMQVTRATDGGNLTPFTPAQSCRCAYLSKVPEALAVPTGCTACTSSNQCAGGSCNFGFCEPDAVSTAGTTPSGCFSGTPTTHQQLINACSSAQSIVKPVTLPAGDPLPIP